MTPTEFLLARIAEDEAVARAAIVDGEGARDWAGMETDTDAHIARHDPARVLAECEAKRRIVAFHESWPVLAQTEPAFESDPLDLTSVSMRMSQQIAWLTTKEYIARFGEEPPTDPIIRALAQPYADHPDFDPAWRAS